MKILVSIVSAEEAQLVKGLKPDILDIKNPSEGSLGAQFPWVLRETIGLMEGTGTLCSATLGDLPFKPGTASLAAYGAALCGVGYIKAGLHDIRNYAQGMSMMTAIAKSVRMVSPDIYIVASGYADYRRFGGLDFRTLVKVAHDSGCGVVMVDTAIKDGKTLFDAMSLEEIATFIRLGHEANLKVALAGSIRIEHLQTLAALEPDIVGIRGAVCSTRDRGSLIDTTKLADFLAYASSLEPASL